MPESSQNTEHASAGVLGLICCIAICATVCYVAFRFTPSSGPVRKLWSPIVVETNGNENILADTRQLEFWTPSTKTQNFLHKENDEVVPKEKWEIVSSEDAIMQFGNMLRTNQNVLGYRREEVFGQGRTSFKPGWWWTVTVLTNYTAGDFQKTYEAFWKSSSPVFVEVIDNRGRTD